MAWRIEFDAAAVKDLKKLDATAAQRITSYLRKRVAPLDNPRNLGAALKGSKLGELWRYRVGDFRIICELRDRELVILAVSIGHRREIYR